MIFLGCLWRPSQLINAIEGTFVLSGGYRPGDDGADVCRTPRSTSSLGATGFLLGLAFGAAVWSAPMTWRDVAVSACCGGIEVGPNLAAQCPSGDSVAIADGRVHLAEAGALPRLP